MASVMSNMHDVGSKFGLSVYDALRDGHRFDEVEVYCTFVGYPRSGHSLVAWLLDAHPETLIAPELDALKYIQAGFTKRQVYSLLLRRVEEARRERAARPRKYSYDVPGQWQGTYQRLRVIGDKKGGGSSNRFGQHPGLYDRLRRTIDDRLVFIHIVRNPFDNIATLAARGNTSLRRAADDYFFMAESIATLRARVPSSDWFEARHEDVVNAPAHHLTALCDLLGLSASTEYLRSCADIVYRSPHRSRYEAPWPSGMIDEITARGRGIPFLAGYSYSDPA